MNYKDFLFDKALWILIWPALRGCVVYTITTLILLIILAVVSRSYPLLLEALQATMPQFIRWAVFLAILLNLAILLISLGATRQYLIEPPLKLENLQSAFIKLREKDKKVIRVSPDDIIPFILFIFVLTGLFNTYVLVGADPKILQPEVTFILPFATGFLVTYGFRTLILIGLLHLKYIIHLNTTNTRSDKSL